MSLRLHPLATLVGVLSRRSSLSQTSRTSYVGSGGLELNWSQPCSISMTTSSTCGVVVRREGVEVEG